MRAVNRWIAWAVVIAVIAGGALIALQPQPVAVDLHTVERSPLVVSVDEEGRTRIREHYVVSSPLTGRLQRIALDAGDAVVAQETTLAVIVPADPVLLDARATAQAEARVRAAEATARRTTTDIDRAMAAWQHATLELGRVREAASMGSAHSRELDEAILDERTTRDDLESARLSEEIAKYELDVARSALLFATGDDDSQMLIRSPINGAVLRVFQESMSVVDPGEPLLEVGDPRDLEVVIDVLSNDAVAVTPGARVVIEQWGGEQPLDAVVRLVEPSAFTKVSSLGIEEQRVNVVADLVTPVEERSTLGDGFRVEARIIVHEASDVVTVPLSAAFRRGDDWAVFLATNGTATLRRIEVGRHNRSLMEVRSGLEPGDRVIIHPSDQLTDGVTLRERSG